MCRKSYLHIFAKSQFEVLKCWLKLTRLHRKKMLCIRAWLTSDHYISITHLCNQHTYSSIFIGSRHTLQWLPEKMLSTAYYLTSVIKCKHHKIRYMFSCVWHVCTQLYVILCDPMGCSSPGSSVLRISQAQILEWVAISSSRGSSQLRDGTRISYIACVAGGFFTTSAIREALFLCMLYT